MEQKILYLFTRTPLHVGAGASVGAIDQPIQRERHTGFPIIPASSIKGTFADAWSAELKPNKAGELVRILKESAGDSKDYVAPNVAWLFGSDDANSAWPGAIQFSEAKVLAFPIRSGKGSFAWITCPLMLARAARDSVPGVKALSDAELKRFLAQDGDEKALFAAGGPLALRPADGGNDDTQIVLEEYTFKHGGELPNGLGNAFQNLLADGVWKEVSARLVILSDGMMSFFAASACEVAQHVRIDDTTGTAADQALFNQENVPSETLFYAFVRFCQGRGEKFKAKTPEAAVRAFQGQDENGNDQQAAPGVRSGSVFQFGGDATTGLGYCTLTLA
jgi:CRISPR-associated protein Cmr4